MERQRIDFLLSQLGAGQHWIHFFRDTKLDQRLASDLGTCHKRVLCSYGQQVRTPNPFLDFDGSRACHLYWQVDLTIFQCIHHADFHAVWTALQATYDQQTANGGEGNPHIASAILAMIFLYSLAFNIGWNPLQVTYVIEILPYHLRAKVRERLLEPPSCPVTDNRPRLGPGSLQPLRRRCAGFQPIRQPDRAG